MRGQHLGLAAVPVRAGQQVVVAGGQHERASRGRPASRGSRVLAVGLVRGHPRPLVSTPACVGAVEHGDPELRLGREPDLVAGSPAAAQRSAVLGPGGGQVELAVDQRPTTDRGVGQEHPELTVVDLPGGAGVLALHPGRAHALLDEPGLVDDEHPGRRVAEVGPARSRAGRRAHRRRPSPRCAAAAASRPGTPPRRARPASSRSCAPDPASSPRRYVPTRRRGSDPPKPARDQLHHRVQRGHPPGKIHHAVIITARPASASHDTPELPLQY